MFEIDNSIISSEELTEKIRHKVFEKNIPQENSVSSIGKFMAADGNNFYAIHKELNSLRENIMSLNNSWMLVELPLRSNRRIIGKGIVFVKKVIRKCLRWMFRPYYDQITNFNGAVTRAISDSMKIQEMLLNTIEDLVRQEEEL